MTDFKKKLLFIQSHPIQYFTPLYQESVKAGLDLEVWYCSNESAKGGLDKQFGQVVKWDIPLLNGYRSRFFKNYSWRPGSSNGFFGLMNFGIVRALFKEKKSILVVYGWSYLSTILAIIFGRMAGHTVCLRAETPLNQQSGLSPLKKFGKKFLIGKLLFSCINYFLSIGKQNRLFYRSMGVRDEQILFAPYSVDNQRFQDAAAANLTQKARLRKEAGVPESATVILSSGKYIQKKRPLVLLEAYSKIQSACTALVMIGEGELRSEMEEFITSRNLKNVILTGFINQSQIPSWYAMGDLFVMPSGDGETWGLSVNEAMNSQLPIIVSDRVGCAEDLVHANKNGFIFPLDDANALAEKMREFLDLPAPEKKKMGECSRNIIDQYSYKQIIQVFEQLLETNN